MKKLSELITLEVQNAFENCGYDKNLGKVVISNRRDLCQYQCNGAMAGAKKYHVPPMEIADKVSKSLEKSSIISSIEAKKPGFLNINLDNKFIVGYLNDCKKNSHYGCESENNTVFVDFGGANVAKPLHVGHLRSAVIGESIKRIKKYVGNNVISDVHLGDWGLQMGLIIEELRDMKPELSYFDENFDGEYPNEAPFTLEELSKIYPRASKKSKEDPTFLERAHNATLKLQNGYKPYTAIWRHIMRISLEDLKKNYESLDVYFDLWKGESDAQPAVLELLKCLEDKGLLRESNGALVVDVAQEDDKKELPPCIVRKSDGAALYATSDLATIIQRDKEYHPDEYIYVADKRQELHFTQVFRVAKKAELVGKDTKMEFLGFGTMNGKDGKPFKTREGGVMPLSQLIEKMNDAVYDKIMENRDSYGEDAKETARIIALSAIKYGDLSNQASKDYIFDVERFASFEGNTGPYLLYTIVRIKSILKKYAEEFKDEVAGDIVFEEHENDDETELMLLACRFNETVEEAAADLAPYRICAYLYELSNSFNRFYHSTRILGEKDEKRRTEYVRLISYIKDILETGIDLLGFKAPEWM